MYEVFDIISVLIKTGLIHGHGNKTLRLIPEEL